MDQGAVFLGYLFLGTPLYDLPKGGGGGGAKTLVKITVNIHALGNHWKSYYYYSSRLPISKSL